MTEEGTTQATFGDSVAPGGSESAAATAARAVAGDGGANAEITDPAARRYPDADGTVEIAVTQVDYTIEGSGEEETPIIHVFGRTADDEVEHVRVHEFRPYFYAPSESLDENDDRLDHDRITGWEGSAADGDPYESIRGESLTKIFGQTPRDVGQIRDRFDHYEADVLFPNRFLIDTDVTSGIRVPERRATDDALVVPLDEVEPIEMQAEARVCTFDIEVDDRSGFPEDGEETIVCLSSHDSARDEYAVWLYEAPGGEPGPEELAAYEAIDGGSGDGTGNDGDGGESGDGGSADDEIEADVYRFDTEEAMLAAFLDYVEDTDPDVMTGWNFTDFDAPYFIDRLEELGGADCEEHDLDPDRLSRVNEVWRSDWQGPNVKGRVMFDLLYAYQRTQFTELDSYRLDAVGEVELDAGKERYPGDIGDLWEDDPERLLEYNLRDVELCVEIDRQQGVIPFWQEVATFVGCKLEDATTPGDAVDMYVLHEAHGKFALPSKGQQETEDFEGGAVFDPITGVKEMVSVLDLKSLYPMSMVTINASPETQVDPETYDGETYQTPTGIHFRKEPDGMIREMVDELLTEREEKKARRDDHTPGTGEYQRFDRQQQAVKVIMNSLYGVFGWDRFRLYDRAMSAGVTSTNREVIAFTEGAANEMGYDVAYGDSVTGDRPVVVRDPNGAVRVLPIERLFDRGDPVMMGAVQIAADGGPVASATPGKDRRSIDGWDALSVNDDGEAEWRPIERAIRHETEKPVVKLQHKTGESVTTRDHSYVVEDGDELVDAPPSDVEDPLRVPELPDVETAETVDVYDVLSGYTREYEDGRSVGNEQATTKVKRVHADDEHVWFGHEHHGDLDSTVKVKRHVDLGGEDGRALVRLLAAYVAEGSASTVETTDAKFGASIAESRREWLEQLESDYHRLFENTTASIVAGDIGDERTVAYDASGDETSVTYDDRTLKLQLMNELAAVFFREFAGQTSRGKRIPSFVFHLPEPEQTLFLDWLVEGDGSREFPRYSDEYAEQHFDYETVGRRLAAGLSTLLTQRGQKHSLKYRDSKGSYTIRTCDYYRSGREPVRTEIKHDGYVYDLSVETNENFVDGVGGIVLHNTDSVMLELGADTTKDEAIDQAFAIEDHINEAYDEFARDSLNADDHRFQIEFEKLYRRFFQAGKKKRYAGHIIWKEGKDVNDVDITGFEYKRSDIAPITKRVQREVIERIVHGEDLDEVETYVHDVIQEFNAEGSVPLDEIGIPGGIGKRLDDYDTDTAQVRGAKYANLLLGTNFQRGSKPKRLYLDRVHPDFFEHVDDSAFDTAEQALYTEFRRTPDVICFEYEDQIPEEFEIDWEKMLDKTLKGPIARVIEAVGVSWQEVKSGQTQTGLQSFT